MYLKQNFKELFKYYLLFYLTSNKFIDSLPRAHNIYFVTQISLLFIFCSHPIFFSGNSDDYMTLLIWNPLSHPE